MATGLSPYHPPKIGHLSDTPSPSADDAAPGRWSDVLTGRLGLYTLVLTLGTSVFAISNFVVVAIMPTAAADIGGLRYYAWIFALFSVGAVIGAAGTGPVREAFGHRTAYVGAGIIFVIGVVGAALAPGMEILVFWRVFQGLGGGAIASQSYALIAEMYPEKLRGRALSFISTSWGVATLLGPTFGGLFAEFGNWRGAFWALAGLGLMFAALAARIVPWSESVGRLVKFPVNRLALLAAAVLGLSATSQFDDNTLRAALVVISIGLAALAFHRDARAERGLFPRQAMVINSEMGAAFWIMMLSTMAMILINLFVTLYLQVLHGISPIGAVFIYIFNSLAWTSSAFLVASWSGTRQSIAIVAGLVLLICGIMGIALVVKEGPVIAIAGLLVVTGFGIGLMNNPLIQRAIAAAPPDEQARTGSSVQAIRTVGQSFGAAIAGLVAAVSGLTDDATPEILGPAMESVHSVGAVFPALALLVTVPLLIHGRRRFRAGE